MPAAQRREAILAGTAAHFARHGFSATTRDLAQALGITQALIYKHFPSKDDLVEQVLDSALGHAASGPVLTVDGPGLEDGLIRFYRDFVAHSTETRMRLFMRAGLDGLSWPTRRGNTLTATVFIPLIRALRQAAGLPGFGPRPAMRGERELVMSLHAGMVFLGIRRHVYGMPMPDNLDDVVDLYVRTFLDGAVPAIARLHGGTEDSLTAQLMVPAASAGPEPEPVSAPDLRRSSKT